MNKSTPSRPTFSLSALIIAIIMILLFACALAACSKFPGQSSNPSKKELAWHGQSYIEINSQKSEKSIHIDPYKISNVIAQENKADIIIITHAHYDHCSANDVVKLIKPGTIILATPDCLKNLEKIDVKKQEIAPDKKYVVGDISIETIPAYTISSQSHPKDKNWVGAIIEMDGKKYYHAGDTDNIPEMSALSSMNIDVAFLPIGGTYTMDGEEAGLAAKQFSPKKVVPIHYGSIVGTAQEVENLKESCGCSVDTLG